MENTSYESVETEQFTVFLGADSDNLHHSHRSIVEQIGRKWQACSREVRKAMNIDVPLVDVSMSHAVYRRGMGCPPGGEAGIKLTGYRNPQVCGDAAYFKQAVVETVKLLAEDLDNAPVLLSFSTVELGLFQVSIEPGVKAYLGLKYPHPMPA